MLSHPLAHGLRALAVPVLAALALSSCGDDDPAAPSAPLPPLASVVTIREASAVVPAGAQGTVDAFRADLGDPNNGAATGSQGAGRREVNWDGISDAQSAASVLPGDFFNAVSARGIILSGEASVTFQVSADGANSGSIPVRFGNLNAGYPTAFATFSAERLFTAMGANVFEVKFYLPGSLTRATVSGFGATFIDVDQSNTSKIEYFDRYDRLLFERTILSSPGNGSLAFLGVTFDSAAVSRVRITAGTAGPGGNDVTQGGSDDIVVLDDFIYGEPQP